MNFRILLTTSLWLALPLCSAAQRQRRFTSNNPQYQASHQLTIGTFSALNGVVPLAYAQALGKRLALQVSAGLTFRSPLYEIQQEFYQDGRHSTLYPESASELGQPFDFKDNYRLSEYRKARPGFMAGAELKYFPGDYSMNGNYVGLLLQFRRYNTVANRIRDGVSVYSSINTYLPDNPIHEHGSMLDLALTCGKTKLYSDYAGGIVVELCAQFGISYQRYQMQDIGARRLQTGSQFDNTFLINGVQNYGVLRPYLSLDLRLGGWW